MELAQQTLKILEAGSYQVGRRDISIKTELQHAIEGSILYPPDAVVNQFLPQQFTTFEVVHESTLYAARRLSGTGKVCCLNFASGRHPGGGWLNGMNAQEEGLTRSSGLYPCINQMDKMYLYNSAQRTALYSDYMIFSPDVPIFRNDAGILLDEPYTVSVITAPAVNKRQILAGEPKSLDKIDEVMLTRIGKILSVAATHNQDTLILGAFGCGVFGNNAEDVAGYFKHHLRGGDFTGVFKRVVFAIIGNSDSLDIFKDTV